MIMFILQVICLIFSAYVFTPLFGNTDLSGIFRFIALAPFGLGSLIFGFVISLFKLLISLICRRRFLIILNLILVVLYLLIGLVFVI